MQTFIQMVSRVLYICSLSLFLLLIYTYTLVTHSTTNVCVEAAGGQVFHGKLPHRTQSLKLSGFYTPTIS